MFAILLFLFIFLPLSEIVVLIKVGSFLGVGSTILVVIGTAILGAALARYQGLKVLFEIQRDLNTGVMPTDKLLDGFMILLAGVVLLTPGFITDAMGFFVLLPQGRSVIKKLIMHYFKKSMQRGGPHIRYFKQDDI